MKVTVTGSKGDWVFERGSGYRGYRCQRCATWVYEGEEMRCHCDNDKEKKMKKQMKKKLVKEAHLAWFRKGLVKNGAPKDISDAMVEASPTFQFSLASFKAGVGLGWDL